MRFDELGYFILNATRSDQRSSCKINGPISFGIELNGFLRCGLAVMKHMSLSVESGSKCRMRRVRVMVMARATG